MRILNPIRERIPIQILALVFALCALATDLEAQSSAQARANALRTELVEVQAKQETLETRLRYLEEEMKSENIEKSLAGIGSTRPENLRELRRRQLEVEKMGIQTQLKLLAESKMRLEARIVRADTDAYHQSAGISPGGSRQISAESPAASASRGQSRARRIRNTPRRRVRRVTYD